jgi:hypothetical protein
MLPLELVVSLIRSFVIEMAFSVATTVWAILIFFMARRKFLIISQGNWFRGEAPHGLA